VDLRFRTSAAEPGSVIQVCGLGSRAVPARVRIYLISTRRAQILGDARGGVRDPRRFLGEPVFELDPLRRSVEAMAVRVPNVPAGRYTLAYWCPSCGRLLGAIWPNRSQGDVRGYVLLRIVHRP